MRDQAATSEADTLPLVTIDRMVDQAMLDPTPVMVWGRYLALAQPGGGVVYEDLETGERRTDSPCDELGREAPRGER